MPDLKLIIIQPHWIKVVFVCVCVRAQMHVCERDSSSSSAVNDYFLPHL